MSGPREGFCTRFNSTLHGCWTSFSSCCSSFGTALKANFVPAFVSLAGRLPSAGLAVFTMDKTMKYMMKKNEESGGMDGATIAMCSIALFTSVWVSCISKAPATFNKLKGNVRTTTDRDEELLNKTCSDFTTCKTKSSYIIIKGAGYFSWSFMNINSFLGVYKLIMFLHGLAKHLKDAEEESAEITKIVFKIISALIVLLGSAFISWIYNVKRSNITAAQFASWLEDPNKTMDRSWIFSILISLPNLVGQFVLANFTTYHAFQKVPLLNLIPDAGLKTIAGVSSTTAVITAGARDTNFIHRMLRSCYPNTSTDPETPAPDEGRVEEGEWDEAKETKPSCPWQALAAATYVIGAIGSICMGLSIVSSFDFTMNDWGTTLYDPAVITAGVICAFSTTLADFAFNVFEGFKSECLPHANRANRYERLEDPAPPPAASSSSSGSSRATSSGGSNVPSSSSEKTPRQQHGFYEDRKERNIDLGISTTELSPIRVGLTNTTTTAGT